MQDAFEKLGVPRQFFLAEEALRTAYTERSKSASEADQQALNEAFHLLLRPDKRIKHLMELAGPAEASAWRAVPLSEDYMTLFGDVSSVKQAAETLIKQTESSHSALARALLAPIVLRLRDKAETSAKSLDQRLQQEQQMMEQLDQPLPSSATWSEIAALQARLAYLLKWQAQVREVLLKLQPW
jgi:hypothetical protein